MKKCFKIQLWERQRNEKKSVCCWISVVCRAELMAKKKLNTFQKIIQRKPLNNWDRLGLWYSFWLLIAIILFFLFGYYLKLSGNYICVLSMFISVIITIIFFIYLFKRRIPKIDAHKIRWELEDSNPYEFEELVADMFKRIGYQSVATTKKSGDFGADITMKKKDIKYVVQVKKYAEGNKISREDLQRLQGSAQHFHATGMIFVTYGFYSRPALDYAKRHGIETIDHNELINLMNKQFKKSK